MLRFQPDHATSKTHLIRHFQFDHVTSNTHLMLHFQPDHATSKTYEMLQVAGGRKVNPLLLACVRQWQWRQVMSHRDLLHKTGKRMYKKAMKWNKSWLNGPKYRFYAIWNKTHHIFQTPQETILTWPVKMHFFKKTRYGYPPVRMYIYIHISLSKFKLTQRLLSHIPGYSVTFRRF